MIASTQTNHPLVEADAGGPAGTALERACTQLKSAGLRITRPRIAILQALFKRTRPASIEQIHEDLADSACDLVTVYRCLAAFEELGLVRRCYFQNGTSLYQIQMGAEPEYHVVTKDTNVVESLDPALATELRTVIQKIETSLKGRGFGDVGHIVEFFGNAPRTRAGAGLPAVTARH